MYVHDPVSVEKKEEKRANQEGAAGSRALWFPLSKHSM
jgi:hypothetical protein